MKRLMNNTAFGLWNLSPSSLRRKLSPREGKDLIKAAYRAGIRIFDTAYSYGDASSLLRAAMRELGKDDICIIDKVMPVPTLRKKVEAELKRLGSDYIDILLLHWPCEEESLSRALEELVHLKKEGKAKHIGVSNFPTQLLKWSISRFPLEYHERPLSLLWSKGWEDEKTMEIKTIAYSPLSAGLLSGKYLQRDDIDGERKDLPVTSSRVFPQILETIHGKPEKALSWVYSQHPWCVVSGFSSISQMAILDSLKELDESEERWLSELSRTLAKEIEYDNFFAHKWHP